MHFRDTVDDRTSSNRVEREFAPPRCPSSDCPTRTGAPFLWKKDGWFERKRAPFRIQRFLCLVCDRSFSTQTFRGTYWEKRPDVDIFARKGALACSANRQIAEIAGCSKSTIAT